jgi:hypothetical protein
LALTKKNQRRLLTAERVFADIGANLVEIGKVDQVSMRAEDMLRESA